MTRVGAAGLARERASSPWRCRGRAVLARAPVTYRGEAKEVTVEGDHGGAVFDGNGAENRVGHEIAGGVRLLAQPPHEGEMARAGSYRQVVALRGGGVYEGECVGHGAGNLEDAAVGRHAEERRPNEVGHAEVVVTADEGVEPGAYDAVVGMIGAVGGEDDVDVEDEHASAPAVEVDIVVEGLVERPVGREVDARPWPATAGEHRDAGRLGDILCPGKLPPEGGLYNLSEGLTALAGPAPGRGEKLIVDRHRCAHDADRTASCASP